MARVEVDALHGKGSAEKKSVLSGVEAKYWLARGDLQKASGFAEESLQFRRSPISLGLMASIEAARSREAEQRGIANVAEMHRRRAVELNKEGLQIDPNNQALQHQLDSL